MDITNDIMIYKLYEEYVCLCNDYQNGVIDNDISVSELKTIQETIGIYVFGLFEIKRREKGGD